MKLSEILELQAKSKNKDGAPGDAGSQAAGRQSPSVATPSKKPLKVLRTRETPNPNALQFVLSGCALDRGKKSYASRNDCPGDKLGEALFDIQGVGNVYIMENFVTVTKDDGANWTSLRDPVWKCIDAHVAVYPSDEREKPGAVDMADYQALSHEDKLKAVETVLNRSIRSNLARDGGGVELRGIEGDDVSIHYQGACGNCPSSASGTLKFIEKLLQQQLHPGLKVKSV